MARSRRDYAVVLQRPEGGLGPVASSQADVGWINGFARYLDIEGDGDIDLVVGNAHDVTVLRSQGDGTFDGGTYYDYDVGDDPFFPFMDPLSVDLDGDGDPDRVRVGDRVAITENICQ